MSLSTKLIGLNSHEIIKTNYFFKRIVHYITAFALLIVFIPRMIAIAIAMNLNSGSIVFKQTRVGLNVMRFKVGKFRSIIFNRENLLKELQDKSKIIFKIKKDRQVTIGKIIREYSMEEIPQLFNVFSRDMSLVRSRLLALGDLAKVDMCY